MCVALPPRVRATAVGWLSSLPSHQLIDLLPQLVEAVKHETWWVLSTAGAGAGVGDRDTDTPTYTDWNTHINTEVFQETPKSEIGFTDCEV